MKWWILGMMSLLTTNTFGANLSVERLFSAPDLAGPLATNVQFIPNSEQISFLRTRPDDTERRDLWLWDAEKGARIYLNSSDMGADSRLSDAEQSRRERLRLYAQGFTEYEWDSDGKSLLIPYAGQVWLADEANKQLDAHLNIAPIKALGDGNSEIHFSATGRYISFVRNQNLYVYDRRKNSERPLTLDGGNAVMNGVAEFIAQEELGRHNAYWWSGNDQYLAFIRVDESRVAIEKRYELNADKVVVTEQRYPRAGSANAQLKIGVIDMLDDHISWLDLSGDSDGYIARVQWLPDHRTLAVTHLSRDQKTEELQLIDVVGRRSRTVVTEHAEHWVNAGDQAYFLKNAAQFLWLSERNGHRHLYLYGLDGRLQKQLTDGNYDVEKIVAVDEQSTRVFIMANAGSVLERQFYSLSLTGSSLTELAEKGGWHVDMVGNKDSKRFIDQFSSPGVPPQIRLLDEQGQHLADIDANPVDEHHPWFPYMADAIAPEFGVLKAADGQELHYRMYKPAVMLEGKRYPVIFHIYGGPHAQLVKRGWDEPFHQLLVQQGFIVFSLDNRGMANRGAAFEAPISGRLGDVEIADQQSAARYLKSLPFVDPDNIGIFGWSYGGYMSLMAMFKAPMDFAAGVSVAPVTDWTLYDTAYTERYLGDPQTHAEAYARSSVFPYIDGLQSPLLLVHGMADDNVLFTHSTLLMKALQDKNKSFELMTYPGARHGIAGAKARTHLYSLILDFFNRHLAHRTITSGTAQ